VSPSGGVIELNFELVLASEFRGNSQSVVVGQGSRYWWSEKKELTGNRRQIKAQEGREKELLALRTFNHGRDQRSRVACLHRPWTVSCSVLWQWLHHCWRLRV